MDRKGLRAGTVFSALTLVLWMAWGDAAAGARQGVALWNSVLELGAQYVQPPMRVFVPR